MHIVTRVCLLILFAFVFSNSVLAYTKYNSECCAEKVFRIYDHPDVVGPNDPKFCLRIDNLLEEQGLIGETTLSCNRNLANLKMEIKGNNAIISGYLYGGAERSNKWVNPQHYKIYFIFYDIQKFYETDNKTFAGFTVSNSSCGEGYIKCINTNNSKQIYLHASQDPAFLFFKDNHRLYSVDYDAWVGRGWLTFNADKSNSIYTQDWIFTAEMVFVTRKLCFWLNNKCLEKSFIAIDIASDIYDYDEIQEILGNASSTFSERLFQQLIVTRLNIQIFKIGKMRFRGQIVDDIFIDALYEHKISGENMEYYYHLLSELNCYGDDICLPKQYVNICSKKCSCRCKK